MKIFTRQRAVVTLAMLFVVSAPAATLRNALDDGPLGLHESTGLQLADGKCRDCATSPQALWYFENEVIAAPKAGAAGRHAPLIWLGSSAVIPRTQLSTDGKSLHVDGQRISYAIVPKIAENRSYYNAASTAYLAQRPLRLRGEVVHQSFVARTIWPLDFALTPTSKNQPLQNNESLRQLVKASGARDEFASRLLWEKNPGAPRHWDNKAVLGIMLNGAQGDDDEAQGGHFAIATGRYRNDGDWSRWLVYNFYGLDSYSEKGIVAAPTPMDKYLLDLNSGQSWYRPSYMLVAVLKNERTALQYQDKIEDVYKHFYRHDFAYNHSTANCAGISMDALRKLGWSVPERGHEPWLKAIVAYAYVAARNGSLDEGRKIYDYLLEESTRLYPAVSFDALAEDLLSIVQNKSDRPLTDYEKALAEDVEAIYYLHIPQVPSSRAFGLAPVYSFDEYMQQVPPQRSDWKIIPNAPRPFPAVLRDGPALQQHSPALIPAPVVVAFIFLLAVFTALVLTVRHWLRRRHRQSVA